MLDECASCGEKKPEYVLDERKLCFDCYRAEKFYWTKDT
jgi:recombinational DNA repair protein (RecF pathway)